MKVIPLNGGKLFAKVDDADYERIVNYGKSWQPYPGRNGNFYAVAKVGNKKHFMHVVIMGQKGIDHRDGDGLNNQRENLRVATAQQNAFNRKRNQVTKTGFKGVHVGGKYKNRFRAVFQHKTIGSFDTPEDAARAYDSKAREVAGEFARTNFPN